MVLARLALLVRIIKTLSQEFLSVCRFSYFEKISWFHPVYSGRVAPRIKILCDISRQRKRGSIVILMCIREVLILEEYFPVIVPYCETIAMGSDRGSIMSRLGEGSLASQRLDMKRAKG